MNLLKIARRPPLIADTADPVNEVVRKMVDLGVGAVAIVDDEKIRGVFTERDLMTRVVYPGKNPETTPIGEVMTREFHVAPPEMPASKAFAFMTDKHFRHLPIVDENGTLQGMLSVRHLMSRIVENLAHELEGLNAYLSADGIGG